MAYKILDVNSVVEHIINIKEIKEFFLDDELSVKEIGDGNLNYVYLVSSIVDSTKAMIVKQAVPYLRCVGEEFPLSRERMTYEIRALSKFKEIATNEVPLIYHSSEEMSLLIMQYLDDHTILRYGLMEQNSYANFADHISTYLASTLFFTSSLYLQSSEKRSLINEFNSNTELCKLSEDFVFTFAFMKNETNDQENVKDNLLAKKLFEDMAFKEKILDLKYRFMTQNDALVHGDLHTGSIMLNENETYVIDPEFAFVGPFGFDIGALVANLCSSYVHHHFVTQNDEFKIELLETIKNILEMFSEKFYTLWCAHKNSALLVDGYIDEQTQESFKRKFIKNIIKDSVGFAGAKMARRVFGVAGVEEIRGIKDKTTRAKAEEMIIDIAREFVMSYENIEKIEQVIEIIKEKSAR
ncbi:MAG: S-methyl-5-thioribose kinase [Helicobacteraceae bacterium]|nr:S-methyl-5-thioribose kinase [Helicobacteraceae bacterium]